MKFSFTFCILIGLLFSSKLIQTQNSPLTDKNEDEIDFDSTTTATKTETATEEKIENERKNKIKNINDDKNEDEDNDNDSDEECQCDAPKSDLNVGSFFEKIIPEDYHPTNGGELTGHVTHINETVERLNRLHSFSTKLMDNMMPYLRQIFLHLSEYLYEAQLEPDCMRALVKLSTAIGNQKPWAMNFLDSTGSLLQAGGFQEGKLVSLAEFDQCLAVTSADRADQINGQSISGQYCLIKPVLPLPESMYTSAENGTVAIANSSLQKVNTFFAENEDQLELYLELFKAMKKTILRFGVCLPVQCKAADVERAINYFLLKKASFEVKVGPKCTRANAEVKLSTQQMVAVVILGLLIFFVLISSMYEMCLKPVDENYYDQKPLPYTLNQQAIHSVQQNRNNNFELLTSFSIFKNTNYLFSAPSSSRHLPLDTLRVLFILFFFVLNSYIFTLLFASMTLKRLYVIGPKQLATERRFFFIRLYYLLDIFFIISGIAFVWSLKWEKKAATAEANFNYASYVLKTYLRYLFPVLFSVGLIWVLPLLGSGPLWDLFEETIASSCLTTGTTGNLFPTFFMYSNFVEKMETICNLPSSFISMTFQVQMAGSLLVLLAHQLFPGNPRGSTFFYLAIFSVLSVLQLAPHFLYNILFISEHRSMRSLAEIRQSASFYSVHPAFRLSSLVLGYLSGSILAHFKGNQIFSSPLVGAALTLAHLAVSAYVETFDFLDPKLERWQLIFAMSGSRLFLAFPYAWLLYACSEGTVESINRFFSSAFWRPLSRLSLGFFLCGTAVTMSRLFSLREPTTLDGDNMYRAILADTAISLLLAYCCHILIQQPMRNLGKVMLSRQNSDNTLEKSDSSRLKMESTNKLSSVAADVSSLPASSTSSIISAPYSILTRFYSVMFTEF